MRHRFILALSLFLLGVSRFCWAGTQSQSGPDQNTRDLSNMFYADTLPAKAPPPKPEPTPKPVKKATPRKPASPAVNISAPERRVGLKYKILMRTPECDIHEVDPAHTFYSGDKVRLQFESNVDGYLYVLQKGSTGRDRVLFPHPQINGGNNRVQRGITYSVPAGQWFTFDNNPGVEQLTVVLSRTPIKSAPQEAKPQEDSSVSVVSVVEELNQSVRSRDLVLFQEKTPESKAPASASAPAQSISAPVTQSTIVINTNQDQNNAVYTDIKLKHE